MNLLILKIQSDVVNLPCYGPKPMHGSVSKWTTKAVGLREGGVFYCNALAH